MKRYLFLDTGTHSAAFNMACDELLLEKVRADHELVFFKVYQWDRPSFTIGHSQRSHAVLNTDACRAQGYDVVRRPTGGRVVLHADELAYAYVARLEGLPERRVQAEMVGEMFVGALRRLGVADRGVTTGARPQPLRSGPPLCCATLSEHEVMVDGKKIMGRAFRNKGGFRLEQGFLLMGNDRPDIRDFLTKTEPGRRDALITKTITIESASGKKVAFNHLAALLYEEACRVTGQAWTRTHLTPEDEQRIGQLVMEKFGNEAWLSKF